MVGHFNYHWSETGYYPEPEKTWPVVKQRATKIFFETKIRSPMKDTDTLEGRLVQKYLKMPIRS